MIEVLSIIAGVFLLFLGGESLVRGSVSLAVRFHLSKFFVSAVIIGFGTSMPELVVTVEAALKGSADLALGNVIGSNTANILLIVGFSAFLNPIMLKHLDAKRDVLFMLVSAIFISIFMFLDALDWKTGLPLFILFVGMVVYAYASDRRKTKKLPQEESPQHSDKFAQATIMCLLGFLMLILGAHLLIEGAVSLAKSFGVSEVVIGLSLAALGTSLPELATAIVASIRKHNDVVIGNILGSNFLNLFGVIPIASTINKLPVADHLLKVDIWVMLVSTFFFACVLLKRIQISRVIGSFMLTVYIAYIYALYQG